MNNLTGRGAGGKGSCRSAFQQAAARDCEKRGGGAVGREAYSGDPSGQFQRGVLGSTLIATF